MIKMQKGKRKEGLKMEGKHEKRGAKNRKGRGSPLAVNVTNVLHSNTT